MANAPQSAVVAHAHRTRCSPCNKRHRGESESERNEEEKERERESERASERTIESYRQLHVHVSACTLMWTPHPLWLKVQALPAPARWRSKLFPPLLAGGYHPPPQCIALPSLAFR